jgi:hypothetical protein
MGTRQAEASLSRLIATLVSTTFAAACTSWHIQNAAPEQVIVRDHPDKLRVTRADSSRIVLSQPRVSGDSLFGFGNHAEVGMPLLDVSSVAERRFDVGKSIGLGVGIPAITVGILYLVACGGGGGDYVC